MAGIQLCSARPPARRDVWPPRQVPPYPSPPAAALGGGPVCLHNATSGGGRRATRSPCHATAGKAALGSAWPSVPFCPASPQRSSHRHAPPCPLSPPQAPVSVVTQAPAGAAVALGEQAGSKPGSLGGASPVQALFLKWTPLSRANPRESMRSPGPRPFGFGGFKEQCWGQVKGTQTQHLCVPGTGCGSSSPFSPFCSGILFCIL